MSILVPGALFGLGLLADFTNSKNDHGTQMEPID